MKIVGVDDPKFHKEDDRIFQPESSFPQLQDVTNVKDFWEKRLQEHLEKQRGWVTEAMQLPVCR